MTRFECIKAMSLPEMAAALIEFDRDCFEIDYCGGSTECEERLENGVAITDDMCVNCMLKWLDSAIKSDAGRSEKRRWKTVLKSLGKEALSGMVVLIRTAFVDIPLNIVNTFLPDEGDSAKRNDEHYSNPGDQDDWKAGVLRTFLGEEG